jgi:sulfofructose kinase
LGCDVLGIGLNATDTLILVPEYPPHAGKIAFYEERLSPGGQVATAMVACARLGLRTKYIGTIGGDLRGEIQKQSLEGTGVDVSSVVVRHDCPNQTAYIVIDRAKGERTVMWHRSERLALQAGEISEEDVAGARMVHLDGCDVEAAAFAAKVARRRGIPVCLDVDTVYPGFDCVLKNVDYLIASANWPAEWTGEPGYQTALERMTREYGSRVAAVTLGDQGAAALCNGHWYRSPAFRVNCVDTTGAGDVFHGAFCYATLSGMDLPAALNFSNAAAALNCTGIGARGHIPSVEEVYGLMAQGHEEEIVK